MKKVIALCVMMLFSSAIFAGGKEFYAANCAGCHGATAQGQGMFPKLAGKKAPFIVGEMHKFKAKKRKLQFPVPIKDSITDAQMKEVAKYISTLK
jgi:cytochrome c553